MWLPFNVELRDKKKVKMQIAKCKMQNRKSQSRHFEFCTLNFEFCIFHPLPRLPPAYFFNSFSLSQNGCTLSGVIT